ncbi:hypothetical protein ANN_28740 [Periplaneta americana]|uniref:Reverse transcriptase domain-containing protein n=1 Tax=Periplaneta americana TaxID=6978 RepID=A0ABQ8TV05_PERAM|nr:hypothetical protein ANN_28740 [Periplaneta americana]
MHVQMEDRILAHSTLYQNFKRVQYNLHVLMEDRILAHSTLYQNFKRVQYNLHVLMEDKDASENNSFCPILLFLDGGHFRIVPEFQESAVQPTRSDGGPHTAPFHIVPEFQESAVQPTRSDGGPHTAPIRIVPEFQESAVQPTRSDGGLHTAPFRIVPEFQESAVQPTRSDGGRILAHSALYQNFKRVQYNLHVPGVCGWGLPTGGVLLPLLWDLVVDALFRELNEAGYLAIGYADDIAVIVKGKFPTTVIDMLQVALKNIENWCNRTKLSVNPNKTVLVPFTRMRSVGNLRKPTLFGERIPYSHRLNTLDLF